MASARTQMVTSYNCNSVYRINPCRLEEGVKRNLPTHLPIDCSETFHPTWIFIFGSDDEQRQKVRSSRWCGHCLCFSFLQLGFIGSINLHKVYCQLTLFFSLSSSLFLSLSFSSLSQYLSIEVFSAASNFKMTTRTLGRWCINLRIRSLCQSRWIWISAASAILASKARARTSGTNLTNTCKLVITKIAVLTKHIFINTS